MRLPWSCLLLTSALAAQRGDSSDADREDLPPGLAVPAAPARAAAEELATFRVAAGYTIELAAAEPLLGDPVQAVFDAAGRLWVVEMRGYMPTVDGAGEREPSGRIAVLEDTDGDGRMDRSTPFLEQLALPRAVLPLVGGALVLAPPSLLWVVDADGDLRPERTEIVCGGFDAGLDNPEHCGNGLLWGLDNRVHLADDARLLRWQRGAAVPFALEAGAGGGQWGIAQDDRGRMFFDYNEDWLRCDLVPGRYSARHGTGRPLAGTNHRVVADTSVWPIRVTPGVNRGGRDGILRDGVLVNHTAACAPFVYRGAMLGAANGDVFVCEPAGNLVRRFRLADGDGRLAGANVHERAEFLASTDERFRPVNLTQGPDGCLYVVDMYRGVIQHRNFVTTFLRKQIVARELERPIGLGRIWRIRSTDDAPSRRPLSQLDTAALVARLCDRDGWQRDQAQRLLVQRGDPVALPPLRALLRAGAPATAQMHALWCLDGLAALAADDLRRALLATDAGVLMQALQLAAPWLSRGDGMLWASCGLLTESAAPCVRWQLALTLGDVAGKPADRALALLAALTPRANGDAVLADCIADSAHGREAELVRAIAPRRDDPGAGAPVLRALAQRAGRRREPAAVTALLDAAAACMMTAQQVAILQGLADALPADPVRRAGWFVFAATPPALAAMLRTGAADLAPLVQQLLAAIELRAEPIAATGPADQDLDAEARARVAAGARVFGSYCAACHQPHGNGMAGLAPPLRDSEWVLGKKERLIAIALFGLRGPVRAAGVDFAGEMPAQAQLGDADLAAALSWLRRAFGHRADTVTAAEIAAVRAAHAGRSGPFTTAELEALR